MGVGLQADPLSKNTLLGPNLAAEKPFYNKQLKIR
jgi:hypothetical protein